MKVELNGEEVEVFTQEELEAQKIEAQKAIQDELTSIKGEYDKLQRIHAEQATNFKRLRDMTEEEKAKLSAEQIELRKMAEKAMEENEALKGSLENERKTALEQKKESLIKGIVGDDAELRTKLESEFGALSETLSLEDRVKKAAVLVGVNPNPVNPLYMGMNGEAPKSKDPKDEKEEFLTSERAKQAMEYMNKIG